MRRSLVLTDERSPHPFLASLPPHVRAGAMALPRERRRFVSTQDLREFLMAYCACFRAVSLYIA
jgi:hypothetical protein